MNYNNKRNSFIVILKGFRFNFKNIINKYNKLKNKKSKSKNMKMKLRALTRIMENWKEI